MYKRQGKYIVLMPNTAKGGGISRKIFNYEERNKIRKILNEIDIPKNMGLIVRTAGSGKSKNEINNDLQGTTKIWEEIKIKTVNSTAPVLIHEEGDIIKRALRDMYDNETRYIHIEGNEGYQKAKSFMKEFMPRNSKYVKKYRGKIPLFHSAGIEKDLNKIFEPLVKLKSGGYLVINPTEALVAIDINSGQSTKQVNIEKTALNTNLEAAEEIARQTRSTARKNSSRQEGKAKEGVRAQTFTAMQTPESLHRTKYQIKAKKNQDLEHTELEMLITLNVLTPTGWPATNRCQADISDRHLFDFQLVASDYTDCPLRYTRLSSILSQKAGHNTCHLQVHQK